MYLEAFHLKAYPFQVAPDATFLYPSKAHARAKAYLDYAIWSLDGFVVITGEIGCGKTILLKKILTELPRSVTVAKVFQTQINEVEFLQLMLAEFGIKAFEAKKVQLLDTLNTFLLNQYQQKRQVVLIVDEAHNLDERVLEEIRLLSDFEVGNEKILNVILAGQSELNQKLSSANLQQLAQRVQLRFHIKPLTQVETKDYIEHRLTIAGAGNRHIFPDDSIPLIFHYTGGVPRLVNILCDTTLTAAFVEDITLVTADLVRMAAEELQWVPYAERAHKNATAVGLAATSEVGISLRNPPSTNGAGQSGDVEEKLNRLYDFVPKFASSVSGKMKHIDEQLKEVTSLLRKRK
jgi:type II secretory pathway predicted ATPase ExeA